MLTLVHVFEVEKHAVNVNIIIDTEIVRFLVDVKEVSGNHKEPSDRIELDNFPSVPAPVLQVEVEELVDNVIVEDGALSKRK